MVYGTGHNKYRTDLTIDRKNLESYDEIGVPVFSGTAILQGFDTEKITKGINGYLRQEFRELDMLDTITLLRYKKLIPEDAVRPLRNPTIRAFQKWASENNIDYSSKWHKSLQWRKNEKIIQEPEKDGTWNLEYAKTREVIEREKNQLGKRKATGNSGQEVITYNLWKEASPNRRDEIMDLSTYMGGFISEINHDSSKEGPAKGTQYSAESTI
ncbi:hypothetical protein CC1G_10774 [Coprinopsis cinerea okayama7|uniref:Uncharacterized protein n=1 Tax=Coprinopsis cinerea (strain Okayama-7 / 130 / ATCC MYA-4618 / FGSC 9003) TaxID=240176 RepID=A8NME9_COPC7|nr:hypothetical protein CC1G_10774 [Coprinopsis cinerea okayama7\|eukprot:XP_001834900.2 hypothetical protein CC1G_10774 [Coprinopsis cinerea okayama7\